MTYTRHAKERCQERGIRLPVVDLILQFGTPREQPDGTCTYTMRQRDREAAARQLRQKLQHLEEATGKVVVAGRNEVITVYHDHS
jgi:hypothetical protein